MTTTTPTIDPDICREFLHGFSSLLLASSDDAGVPESSYSPFILAHDAFFILVSELSGHTANLRRQQVSVMFIENESEASNIYTRRRLIIQCKAKEHSRTSTCWTSTLPFFRERFGETISVIETLADFVLMELQPLNGRWITGFGQAFSFDQLDFLNAHHIGPNQIKCQRTS